MDNCAKEKNYIYLAKFFAVLLVLNSHLDKCYPIPALATGGALGNALFFFVSGYTWWNAKNKDFLDGTGERWIGFYFQQY